jgi:hypothetical protein
MTGSVNDTIAWFVGAFTGSMLASLILIRDAKYIAEQYKLHREERQGAKIEKELQRRLKQRREDK